MVKAHSHISRSISSRKRGSLLFATDFRGAGSQGAIKMALSRLNREGKIKRVAHGIYMIPQKDPLFGELLPAAEEVARAIAQKEKIKIKPAGAYALHRLGLSTQVPARLVYLTDGESRQITLGRLRIQFKATTPKKMAMQGELSSLVIQALEELDISCMEPSVEAKILVLLKKEDPLTLKNNLALAPGRIYDYILYLLKKAP